MKKFPLYTVFYLLPKNCLSRLLGTLVTLPLPKKFAIAVNRWFARVHKINLDEAENVLETYPNLQEFFIRKLKPGLRPIDQNKKALVSPCDGYLSVSDKLDKDQLLQIKGKYYGLNELFGDKKLAEHFSGGHHATIYLSPKDYHRFHAPVAGDIIETYYVPGALWPVNQWAVENVDQLFCQNERVITIIKERHTGKLLAHVAIGACVVGKIALAYVVFDQYDKGNKKPRRIKHETIPVQKGDELGRFMFGSTIVLLMEPLLMTSFTKEALTHVRMGEILGNLAITT